MSGSPSASGVSIMRPEERDAHPDSVGRPLAGTEVRVVDEDASPCRPARRASS
jgi:acyl-CoA synthetase (AMP-forming)/AMP-acid ligase II